MGILMKFFGMQRFALIKKSMSLTINNYHGYIIRLSLSLKEAFNKVVIWKTHFIKEMAKQEAINFMYMTEKVKDALVAMRPL
ncbi:hypothetical protein AYJ66_17505 [Dietzia cinnamea]|nr:hypothetical protein AYJ66_17505 [Dietzia cinnamea]